ncbi:MAG: cyclic nucleotide-binding domain-containing protein, partial [Deltaproteobacteria bacterium]
MDKVSALRSCSLFEGFTEIGLQILASIATEKEVPDGAPLYVEGMLGDTLYILIEGEVRVAMKDAQGTERTLTTLTAGESFGELALLGGGIRLASTYAVGPCRLLEIHAKDFTRLQRQKPQACLKLLMSIV